MALSHVYSPMRMSGHSPAGERQRAGHIPGLSFLLVSCTMACDRVGCFEDLYIVRKVVAEMVLGMMASPMGMVAVALAGSQPELYRRVMVTVLAVPIVLGRKGGIPVVIALAVVGSQLVFDRKGMVPLAPIEGFHTRAVVEAADS